MKLHSLLLLIIFTLIASLALGGCGKEEAQPTALDTTTAKETVVSAEPQRAVDEIYDSLEEYSARSLSVIDLRDTLGLNIDDIFEYNGKISDAREGLSDVFILKPEASKHDDIRLALNKYKEARIAEFENFDILGATEVAQKAVIYEQGDYIIMLMLEDNDAARKIVDKYIPL